jgi:hypothetical protein
MSIKKKNPLSPGLSSTVLNQLKTAFAGSPPEERLINVLFDEISLATEVHYDAANDFFNGYADDGTERALVAMITWINKSMKQSVGYWFLGKSGNSDKVKCLICDQGTRNIGLMKKFKITPDKPFFQFKTGDEECKVYLIFDPPHLFKSFRNNLFNKRFEYLGGFVDWELIHKVYLLSIETNINLIPKINDSHFNMYKNSAKMTVSLATQIFRTQCLMLI